MRARAPSRAQRQRPALEMMIPLVDYERRAEIMRELVVAIAEQEGMRERRRLHGSGTMIELPRACCDRRRDRRIADFFSFGTNDLTQTALGFSRDDIERKILAATSRARSSTVSPFETIDRDGVGVARAHGHLERPGRRTRTLELGVCGEHGGDPDSIDFFHEAGLDYVSCSPFRVPIARVAAAQAAIRKAAEGPMAAAQGSLER